ncbi:MAG: BrnA antitoxin family protein [Burkholderiales bacterium]
MTRSEILEALKHPPPGGDYVWDGVDEDDRPATDEELEAGLAAARKARGRPPGSTKESTTIRLDQDVLEAFRAGGAGWQSRINAALREWLQSHKAA